MAERLTTRIAALIDNTVIAFTDNMNKSGKNAWNRVRPLLNDLTDIEGKLSNTQSPTILDDVERALNDAFTTNTHQKRIDALKRPIEDIRKTTLRDFTRKFGLVSDTAIEQSKQLAIGLGQDIDAAMSLQEFENNIFLPVLVSVDTHIAEVTTKDALLKDAEHRIIQGTEAYGTAWANGLYESYSRALNDTFAASFELVFVKYDGPTVGTDKTPDAPRDFCDERVRNFYHINEVASWGDLTWEGKIAGTNNRNIFVFLGGYNCRHKLVYVKASQVPEDVLRRNGFA